MDFIYFSKNEKLNENEKSGIFFFFNILLLTVLVNNDN